jgi:septal ring factor EnvC (AmiA/AmiB activator)
MHRASALGVLLLCGTAHAQQPQTTEIYRCIDNDGRRHYTNSKKDTVGMRQCELVTSQQINVAPAPSAPASRATFPRESASTSASARNRQREILERELANEQKALEQARQALAQQEAVRMGDERNYARVEERLQPFKDTINNHENNIKALQRELGNLK